MRLWGYTPKERFLARVLKQSNGCWEWQGFRFKKTGHGQFWLNGRDIKAQRAAWLLYRGEIPDRLYVLHQCNNACCVNPDHLYLGTHQDNMRDVATSGNHRNHGGTYRKLDWTKVHQIRQAGCTPQNKRVLARDFGVSITTIERVMRQAERGGWRETDRSGECS